MSRPAGLMVALLCVLVGAPSSAFLLELTAGYWVVKLLAFASAMGAVVALLVWRRHFEAAATLALSLALVSGATVMLQWAHSIDGRVAPLFVAGVACVEVSASEVAVLDGLRSRLFVSAFAFCFAAIAVLVVAFPKLKLNAWLVGLAGAVAGGVLLRCLTVVI